MHQPAACGRRNAGIDALRGLAIVLVVLNHIGIRIPLAKTALARFVPAPVLKDLNYNGYEAVFIFFVISGFLITRRAQERWGSLRALSIRDFYVRRAARILPCLVALVGVLGALHLAGAADYTIHRTGQSLAGATMAALGLHLNWYEGATGYLPGSWDVLWSLSIEEVFYLAFPLACVLAAGTRWFVALLMLLVLSMPFTHAAASGNEIWQEKAYLPGMAAIAAGVLGALLAQRVPKPSARVLLALRFVGALGIVLILFAGRTVWSLLRDGYLLVLTGSALSLVVALHWTGPHTARWRVPGLDWLRSCGRLSYEIYLTHMFCVFAAVALARASGSDGMHGWIWYPVTLGAAWLLGAIVAKAFSVPCERWLRQRAERRARALRDSTPAVADV